MSAVTSFLALLGWRDLVDILAVAFILYYILQLIRGTRAVQMLLGILFGVVVYDVARLLKLQTLESLLQKFLLVLPFAVVVLFQHEIRRALANFGRNPFWRWSSHHDAGASFGDIVHHRTPRSKFAACPPGTGRPARTSRHRSRTSSAW